MTFTSHHVFPSYAGVIILRIMTTMLMMINIATATTISYYDVNFYHFFHVPSATFDTLLPSKLTIYVNPCSVAPITLPHSSSNRPRYLYLVLDSCVNWLHSLHFFTIDLHKLHLLQDITQHFPSNSPKNSF